MTKDELRNYKHIKAEIEQLERLLEEIEGPLYAPKVPQLTGMPGAPSDGRGGSQQERLADSTAELRELYRAKIEELTAEQLGIEHAIDSLGPRQRKLLRHKYIEGMTWETICVQMGYSWRQVHRIHADALEKLRHTVV